MKPVKHYYPDATPAYAVEKLTVGIIYALEAARRHPLIHLDIKSAFTAEEYNHDKQVYVKQIPRADMTMTHGQQQFRETQAQPLRHKNGT